MNAGNASNYTKEQIDGMVDPSTIKISGGTKKKKATKRSHD